MRILTSLAVAVITALPAGAQDISPFAAFDLAGPAVLNDPHDLAFGPDGYLYVADKFGNRIVVLDPETLDILRIIHSGSLPQVRDISFGPNGRAAVSVSGESVVMVFEGLDKPTPLVVEVLAAPRTEGSLYHSNGRIYAMASGIGVLIAYENGEIVATAGGHGGAHDVAEDPEGNVWVADNANRRLVKYGPDLNRLAVLDHAKFGFIGPRYLDFDAFGRLVVADQQAHRVLLIDPDGADGGALIGAIGNGLPGKGPGQFDDPEGVTVKDGRYFISDSDNNRVVRYAVVLN
ncbi:MAG: NHL repeat-containing protein [Alphaproteobacteria bacterium]